MAVGEEKTIQGVFCSEGTPFEWNESCRSTIFLSRHQEHRSQTTFSGCAARKRIAQSAMFHSKTRAARGAWQGVEATECGLRRSNSSVSD